MALKPLNSVAGFSVGETPANIILANGDITTTNITTTGVSNLNSVSNVRIAGGTTGQVIQTDGLGNLSFVTIDTWRIQNGSSNVQALANSNVTVTVSGNANIAVFTSTGVEVNGYLTVNGNVTANGNLSANNYLVTPATKDLIIAPSTQLTRIYANTNPFSDKTYDLGNSLARWNNVYSNTGNFSGTLAVSGNASVGGLLTDNLYYANGTPWDLQEAAGANNEIQYNINGNFAASANFTYNDATQQFTVTGNGQFNNANLGNLATANFVNVASNTLTNNLTVNLALSGNTANFTGNVAALNANLGNLATANFVNVASNAITNNLTVNLELAGNTANFSSNVVVNNLTTNLELQANTANFDGNVVMDSWLYVANTANVGNLRTNNLLYANGQPWDMQEAAGSNYQIQYNLANNFAASANFTYNDATQQLTVLGNSQFNNANLGNLATANYVNVANDLNVIGNLNAGNLVGVFANGTSNIKIYENSNVEVSIGGTANIVSFTTTGLYVDGEINTTEGNILSNGNVTANGFINSANAFVTGTAELGIVQTDTINSDTGNITIGALAGNNSIVLVPTGTGAIDVSAKKIVNLAEPTNPHDAATKNYVDTVAAEGLHVQEGVDAATTNTLAILSGGTVTYNNGTSGVGATLTTTGSFTTGNPFDGVVVATNPTMDPNAGGRVLVKNEANAAHNGIYYLTSNTVLTRDPLFDSDSEIEGGDFVFVVEGATLASTGWVQTATVNVVGTDPIVWQQFSGAGTYTGGDGIAITGTVISVKVDNETTAISSGNVVVKVGANLTTPNIGDATFSSISWNNLSNGNVSANNLSISNIANITANLTVGGNVQVNGTISSNSNVSGLNLTTSGNVEAAGNVVATNITANSTVFAANANVSGTTITNELTVNNAITGNTANFSGNIVVNNATVNLELSGNTANFSGNATFNGDAVTVANELAGNTANFSGNISASNANLGNLVTANYFTGTLVNGTSNAYIAGADGNFVVGVNGVANVLSVNSTGANITGNLGVSGNFTVGALQSTNLTANTAVYIGNTTVTWGTVTTTSVTANQTIASLSVTGITGLEFLVKAVDASGSKYSVATVQAVTDGTNVDYATYGTVQLGGYTGSLAVNVVGGFVRLQVTPSSSNSTVWTTQARTI